MVNLIGTIGKRHDRSVLETRGAGKGVPMAPAGLRTQGAYGLLSVLTYQEHPHVLGGEGHAHFAKKKKKR